MRKLKRRSDCPIGYGLDLFGDKWSLLIIRDMIFEKKSGYGEFLSAAEGISTNILADRLALLEQEKVIRKQPDKFNKSKYVYTLTQKGRDLFPIMVEIILWSYKYDKMTKLSPDFISMIKADKELFINKMTGD